MMRCALFVLVLKGITCVYFTEKRPTVCLNTNTGVGTVLGRVFAYSNIADNCSAEELIYDIDEESGLFSINNSGWLQLNKSLPESFAGNAIVSAHCMSSDGTIRSANTSLKVIFRSGSVGVNISEEKVEELCFGSVSDTFYIEENTGDVILGTLNRCEVASWMTMTYQVNKPKAKFSIDSITSEIRLLRPLDRETLTTSESRGKHQIPNVTGLQQLLVSCTILASGITYTGRRRTINVSVLDVCDSPPVFPYHGDVQCLEKSVQITSDLDSLPTIDEVVLDLDAWQNNSHSIQVVSDPYSVCNAETTCMKTNLQTVCRFLIHLVNLNKILSPTYRCEVRLIDNFFIQDHENRTSNAAIVVVNIQQTSSNDAQPVQRVTIHASRTLQRHATRFSRVIQMASSRIPGVTFSLVDSIFAVTKTYGIVYVDNPAFLVTAPENISIVVQKSSFTDIHLHIHLLDSSERQTKCESGCSIYDTTIACQSGCGLGLTSGNCVMRGDERNSQMDYNYGTCTHDVSTCPDRRCDELEDLYPILCPQDCTTEVNGVYLLNTNTIPPRGIAKAKGPCWCEEDYGVICTCMPGQHVTSTERQTSTINQMATSRTNPTVRVYGNKEIGNVLAKAKSETVHQSKIESNDTIQEEALAIATEETTASCNSLCATGIGLGSGALIAISFSLFMLWFTKKKNDRRKSSLKHVGSVVSMTAVPSDYYEESRVSYSSPQWTPKGPSAQSHQLLIQSENNKWEVPRENLTLDQTLGEGEFGRVVKAQVLGLSGENTEKNVAVKMLKHCATAAEEHDLWSEFNLLKDVNHPNVIRLLGVCTSEGPFYVIVEYCEHGCLLKYLRRSRLEENGYINQNVKQRYQSPENREQTDPNLLGDLLSIRDLLSFAWQIAKGMSYLSGIKLVHRDLAARNVLVSAGRMLKISDFGLTRDVYEADTYLKKSRGRIPVKWLAPESLYAQIYTTKSDVWSYGIVLWEIATLGAPPYPGIPPERLYNLLIGGYRMDRPESCPDEMYAVMQKCWKTDASDRPTFNSLAEIFDRILQEKTGYLDLSVLARGRHDVYKGCLNHSNGEDWTSEHSNAMDSSSDSAKIEDMDLTTVCNYTYLTPESANKGTNSTPLLNNIVHLEDEMDTSSNGKRKLANAISGGRFLRKVTGIGSPSQRQSRGGNLVHPSENVALLKDSGRATFVNLPESTDEASVRISLECLGQ